MKKLIFLTGRPGVGKTTVLKRVVEAVKGRGYTVGGMISSEIRVGFSRVGFEIVDLQNGRRGILAHIDQWKGPRVSKYGVNLRDLAEVGATAINQAVEGADLIVVDEVGPMELYSSAFKEAVRGAVESGKPLLGTIHYRARDPLIDLIESREDTEIVNVTLDNRESLHERIASKILMVLESRSKG